MQRTSFINISIIMWRSGLQIIVHCLQIEEKVIFHSCDISTTKIINQQFSVFFSLFYLHITSFDYFICIQKTIQNCCKCDIKKCENIMLCLVGKNARYRWTVKRNNMIMYLSKKKNFNVVGSTISNILESKKHFD